MDKIINGITEKNYSSRRTTSTSRNSPGWRRSLGRNYTRGGKDLSHSTSGRKEAIFKMNNSSTVFFKNDLSTTNPPGCSEVQTESKNLIFAIALIVICVFAVLGNLVVCATVYFHRTLHSVTNLLIVSLACADLFVSVFSMPLRVHFILHNQRWCLSIPTCAFWIWTDCFACSASIGNLAAVSIERFIAIKYPLRYHSILRKRAAFKIIIFIWLYSLAWASLGNFNWTAKTVETFRKCSKDDPYYYTVISSLAFFLPLAVIVSTYSYLTKVAIQQRRALFNAVPNSVSSEFEQANDNGDRGSRFLHELKATKVMAIVVGAFFLCWFPFFVLLMISLWNFSLLLKMNQYPVLKITLVQLLPNLNSSLNPVIYIAFTRELRQATFSVFGRFTRHTSRLTRRQLNETSPQSSVTRNSPPGVEMTPVANWSGFS